VEGSSIIFANSRKKKK